MPRKQVRDRTFDARPDRVDFRDRRYRPALVSLPERFPSQRQIDESLPRYRRAGLILDQGEEGACTGFGLTAVINYLLWRMQPRGLKTVSPRMLYHMARIYDEWAGEDYEGSSCRGAMKGWHRHGVTTDALWPYRDRAGRIRFLKPKRGWQLDAAMRPLGAYYRIAKTSIADMQAAIHEVGAIYCSADVHDGWFLEKQRKLPLIPIGEPAGGHAFAIVGYTSDGFIVQNSWGPDWGWNGFAVMGYRDWIQNGADAWVAVLGAPMRVSVPRARAAAPLEQQTSGRATWLFGGGEAPAKFAYRNPEVAPLDESTAREHTIVLGNDGRPINHLIDQEDAAATVDEVSSRLPAAWLQRRQAADGKSRLAIYAHGGLNDEDASIRRIRIMAPYFRENGIYPLFVTWKTGLGESLQNLLSDVVADFFGAGEARARGWLDDAAEQIRDARDRSVEVACENALIKPIWSQMKQNAAAGAANEAGLGLLAKGLAELRGRVRDLEIHLIGHSAGSLILGHLLGQLKKKKLRASSLTLYAPACTVDFANEHYRPAVAGGVLAKKTIHLDVLSDDRERADSVGPYGKSLLYLVSRALETGHKTPLLGMEAALAARFDGRDLWREGSRPILDRWRSFAANRVSVRSHTRAEAKTGDGSIPLAHGSFDNDVEVVTETLERILGGPLATPVENLGGV
jgi:hypothetical protein